MQDKINMLQETNRELMCYYGKEETMLRRRIQQVDKTVPTRFARMVMCISRAIS